MFSALFFLLVFLMIIGIPIMIVTKIEKSLKIDAELQRKKKEKEIELLQAQIDSLKEGKGT